MEKSKYLLWLDGEDWKKNKQFMQCLIDTGGLPRALEYFLECVQNIPILIFLNFHNLTLLLFEKLLNKLF